MFRSLRSAMLISRPGETARVGMVEWNRTIRLFRFSGILGQPREVHPKFRNEIRENVCSIRSPTRNFWSNGKRPRTPTTFLKRPKTDYRRIHFNAIDTVTQCIATRFEQEDFKIYVNTQELLLTSFASEPCDTELAEVGKLDYFKLKGHLLLLPQTAE